MVYGTVIKQVYIFKAVVATSETADLMLMHSCLAKPNSNLPLVRRVCGIWSLLSFGKESTC